MIRETAPKPVDPGSVKAECVGVYSQMVETSSTYISPPEVVGFSRSLTLEEMCCFPLLEDLQRRWLQLLLPPWPLLRRPMELLLHRLHKRLRANTVLHGARRLR